MTAHNKGMHAVADALSAIYEHELQLKQSTLNRHTHTKRKRTDRINRDRTQPSHRTDRERDK